MWGLAGGTRHARVLHASMHARNATMRTTYQRPDGSTMVEVAPHCFVEREAALRLGLILK
ncbi:hypothetical protein GCM10007301_15380 [Azorhizobium oxalatiphilum]|uniref:Uncharacterized protein n=1 Tax=Azorhizobium oxalatiphilum TaxID=980631 RepID=A0A917BRU3_9HYPH|nr:hypothetical protein GCM10007301_15380 [Azorhizobium oxalatiphilum]